jgi:hypothetical protein
MKEKLYQRLSVILGAKKRCEASNNQEWLEKHEKTIQEIMSSAPRGSGIDSGTILLEDKCIEGQRLVFQADFHHMDKYGFYSGWTTHTITVYPTFSGIQLDISGRNRNELKSYLYEIFSTWLETILEE